MRAKRYLYYIAVFCLIIVCFLHGEFRSYAAKTPTYTCKISKKNNVYKKSIKNGSTLKLISKKNSKTVKPNQLKYRSQNKNVASVSKNGVITAKKTGTTLIVVTSKKNKKLRYTIKLTVKSSSSSNDDDPVVEVPVEEIEIIHSEDYVIVGTTIRLAATPKPYNASIKKVTWSSSNAAIATVSEGGTVTGISEGKVIITATATDGSGVTSSISIDVYEDTYPKILEYVTRKNFRFLRCNILDTNTYNMTNYVGPALYWVKQTYGYDAMQFRIQAKPGLFPNISSVDYIATLVPHLDRVYFRSSGESSNSLM
ncbi:Ig-like domain-containing protein, partial [Butyrivibrio sp. ob235]|uniref:Ig-like domain-containing protein n=1 Tax=Butyrivibrio sp. ob235 TaxID=1761780 RepID=UPI00158707A0